MFRRVKKAPYLAQCSGKIKSRFFQLSRDKSMIRWGCTSVVFSSMNMSEKKDHTISEKVLDRHLMISNIEKIIYGPRSLTWQKYLNDIKGSWRCLSIVVRVVSNQKTKEAHKDVRKRTIDLLFSNENETLGWFLGLNYLLSEYKKKVLAETHFPMVDIESRRDVAINKKLSDYKWAKLRLQVSERALQSGKSISSTVEMLLPQHK